MTTPNNTVAGLPAKWREEAAPSVGSRQEHDADSAYDDALERCADELEAALASPAPSAPVGVRGYPLWQAIHAASEKAGVPCNVGLAQVIDALDSLTPPSPAAEPPKYEDLIRYVTQPEARGVEGMVLAEVERATAKFPTWPTDPLHAVAVLGEEFGELTKAVLQSVYEPHKNPPGAVRTEALQTAAMALRFLASVDRYEAARCPQHKQGEQ